MAAPLAIDRLRSILGATVRHLADPWLRPKRIY